MSKDIWHTPSETTDTDNNLIIKDFVNRTYEIGWFDDNDMIFRNFRNNDTYDEEGMMKWCDVDDLVNDYERLQKELIRTRKALETIKKELDIRKKQAEIANKAFDFINTEWDNVDCSRKELGACAFNAKEDIAGWESDIETALEQKDK